MSPLDPQGSDPGPLRIGLVDRSAELEDLLVSAAERGGVAADLGVVDPPSALGATSEREDVLVLGRKELSSAGLKRLTRYLATNPLTVVIAVGADPTGADRDALRAAGVSLVVKGEPTLSKLTTALRKASVAVATRQASAADWELEGTAVAEEPEVAEPEVTEPLLDDPVHSDLGPGSGDEDDLFVRLGLEGVDLDALAGPTIPAASGRDRAIVLTVASATGGCGKTFFATNLAALVARGRHRALLVDLDLQFGEVAAALRVSHPYSVYDGLYDPQGRPLPDSDLGDHLDELVHHHPLGFDVLTAPRDPALADYVGARDAAHILDTVSTRYDVVIVDTPPSLNEVVLTALDRSDVVSVLATLDVPALKNLTVFLDTLRRLKIDDSSLRLVMNKVEPDVGIDVKQAQSVFANRFVGQIPQSRAVSRSINAGSVVVSTEPRTAVSRMVTAAVAATLPDGLVTAVDLKSVGEGGWRAKLSSLFRRQPRAGAHTGGVE